MATQELISPSTFYIGRCKVAGCKHTVRVEDWNDLQDLTPEQYKAGDFDKSRGFTIHLVSPWGWCEAHDKPFPLKYGKGRVVESIACTAKCLNAHGPSCDCSCGGANHGRGYAS